MQEFFSVILNFMYIVNLILALVIFFKKNRNPAATMAWMLTVLFIPVLGFLLYIITGGLYGAKHMRDFFDKKGREKDYYNILNNQLKNMYNDNLENDRIKEYKDFIRMNLTWDKSIYTYDNDIEVFIDGNKKYQALIKDIKNAKNSINMQYFIIRNDKISKEILSELTKKAKDGVEVRFLYDKMGSFGTPKSIFKELKAAGGRVEMFYPSIFKINYRNHRKIVVIDGLIGYVGGFNIGDEYCGEDKRLKPWRDTHIKILGSAVNMLQMRFFLDWFYASNEEIPLDECTFYHLFFPKKEMGEEGCIVQIVSSGPEQDEEQIKMGYIKMISSAKKTLYIQTPYFIPDDHFLGSIKIAAMCGVDVRIMIPSIADKKFVYYATLAYLKEVLPYGVKIYFYDGFLHSKTIVMDDSITSVGTANMDIRSFALNFEVNAFVYDKNFAIYNNQIFMDDLKNCKEIDMLWYENINWWNKIMLRVFRVISPIF